MKSVIAANVLFCVLCSTVALHASEKIGTPESGVELGLGWDSQTSQIIPNRCIEFAPVQEKGQTISLEMHEVSDSSEIMEHLNVSASMSMKSKLGGGGSAQGSFASNQKVTSSSNSLLINAEVSNGVLFVGPSRPQTTARLAFPLNHSEPRRYRDLWDLWEGEDLHDQVVLTEAAREILGDGSLTEIKQFEKYCGDSYVGALYGGAQIIAVMSISSTDTTKTKKAKAAVKASFSAWGVTGSGSISSEEDSSAALSSATIDINYTQIGGSGGIIPTSKQDFDDKLHDLPSEALRGPQFHNMETIPYTQLPEWPQYIALEVDQDDTDVLLSNYYWTFSSVEDQIQHILNSKASYKLVDDDQKSLIKNLKLLEDLLIAYRRDIFRIFTLQHQLAGKEAESSYFFGLLSKKDPKLAQKFNTLNTEKVALVKSLVNFTFGKNNPNLVRLNLPAPESITMAASTNPLDGSPTTTTMTTTITSPAIDLNATSVVAFYLAKQSRRTCKYAPTSDECLSSTELARFESCVPQGPNWQIATDSSCLTEPKNILDAQP